MQFGVRTSKVKPQNKKDRSEKKTKYKTHTNVLQRKQSSKSWCKTQAVRALEYINCKCCLPILSEVKKFNGRDVYTKTWLDMPWMERKTKLEEKKCVCAYVSIERGLEKKWSFLASTEFAHVSKLLRSVRALAWIELFVFFATLVLHYKLFAAVNFHLVIRMESS